MATTPATIILATFILTLALGGADTTVVAITTVVATMATATTIDSQR
jgi:hypothetical protein